MIRPFYVILILLSGILIGLSFILTPSQIRHLKGEKEIAQLLTTQGDVKVIRYQNMETELVKQKTWLFASDIVETSEFSAANLNFSDTAALLIKENTWFTIDQSKDRIVVYLKKGDIKILSPAKKLKIFINTQGEDVPLEQYQAYTYQIPTLKLGPTDAVTAPPEIKATVNVETLNPTPPEEKKEENKAPLQDLIVATLQKEKTNYYKCYTNFLQKQKVQAIEANISLTITKEGKSISPKVLSLSTQDPEIKDCLVNVTSRIEVKGYKSDEEITTTFPLKFE